MLISRSRWRTYEQSVKSGRCPRITLAGVLEPTVHFALPTVMVQAPWPVQPSASVCVQRTSAECSGVDSWNGRHLEVNQMIFLSSMASLAILHKAYATSVDGRRCLFTDGSYPSIWWKDRLPESSSFALKPSLFFDLCLCMPHANDLCPLLEACSTLTQGRGTFCSVAGHRARDVTLLVVREFVND